MKIAHFLLLQAHIPSILPVSGQWKLRYYKLEKTLETKALKPIFSVLISGFLFLSNVKHL